MRRMSARIAYLFAAVCLAANGLVWAGHVDLPVPAENDPVASEAHAHYDGLDLVKTCDHCCHAGAHLVALPQVVISSPFVAIPSYAAVVSSIVSTAKVDPPFIPPIA